MAEKKRLLSGIKASGQLHLGNYLGAMEQFLEFQEEYEGMLFIADYHALNTTQNAKLMREQILHTAAGYLAVGINPQRTILFKQSDIPEHTELAWIFNTITPMGTLLRAHAYKDAQAKNKDINVGTFEYPVLMAADILMYDPHIVPVGKDQQQHVEIARDTAERFNTLYGETFRLPEVRMRAQTLTVPGTDGRKMSKSYGNVVPLFGSDAELEKAVMSIVTDSKGEREPKDPANDNVFALHRHFSTGELPELERRYLEGTIGYRESKELLLANITAFVAPKRERYKALIGDTGELMRILEGGAEKARAQAQEKMKDVRKRAGVALT